MYPQSRIHSSFDKFTVFGPKLAFIMSLWICSNFIKINDVAASFKSWNRRELPLWFTSAKISFQEDALNRQSSCKTVISFCLLLLSLPLPVMDGINGTWSTPGWKSWASRRGQSGTKEGFAESRSQKKGNWQFRQEEQRWRAAEESV